MTITLGQIAAVCTALMAMGGVFTAVARWLDSRFEKQIQALSAELEKAIEHGVNEAKTYAAMEAKAVRTDLSAALVGHDANSHAHPTHFMTPLIQGLQLDITRSLTEMRGEIKALSAEVASLRRAHDDAVAKGVCLFQQDCAGKDR